MSSRRYRLACPIARALDRVGDRWTLLLLRDLHAGPARFGELQQSLPGLAPNLLTSRLTQLLEDGLVERTTESGAPHYRLSESGRDTAPILAELAWFGSRFELPEKPIRPGNMRLIAVPMQEALRSAITARTRLQAELLVDGEPLHIRIDGGEVAVRIGPDPNATVAVSTDYDSLLATGEGRLGMQAFFREKVEIIRGNARDLEALARLMAKAFEPNGE